MATNRERVVLVDGSALAFRAFFALPSNLQTSYGLPTNAIFGFAKMFRKVFAGKTPVRGAVVFDAPGKKFRARIDARYKAERAAMPDPLKQQLPYIDQFVTAHNFPILRVPDVEADDVIGTLAVQAVEQGREVLIVSGDKDFAQLVGEHVRLFEPVKEVFMDSDAVFRKWGVRPEQFIDYLALVGDKIDNIPGVAGIGKKGAADLLTAHASLDGILGAELKGRQKSALEAGRGDAILSRELATIKTDVALDVGVDDLVVTKPTPEQLNEVYRELEFYSLLSADAADSEDTEYFVCDTAELAQAAIAELLTGETVALHVLWELPTSIVGPLVGVAASPKPGRALYFPWVHLDILRPWLEDPDLPKVCHGAKEMWVVLKRYGVELRGVVGDTAVASFLIHPTKILPHRLEQVARQYIQKAVQPLRPLVGGGKSMKWLRDINVGRVGAYGCHLADTVGQIWPVVEARMRNDQMKKLHDELDLPLSYVLGKMELDGVLVEKEALEALGLQFKAERKAVLDQIHTHAGRTFNPGSLKQLGKVLFEELGLPIIKRTKTGYSTSADVLERLRTRHPIIDLVLRWRAVDKLINTYTDVLAASVHPQTGRIHASFQATVSASGRLITTEPDLQRTPVRTDESRTIRDAFRAPEGWKLISADWSQIELRLMAHFSGDPRLIEAYNEGVDVHTRTASLLFVVEPEGVTDHQRNIGKTVNFATIYGQGSSALAQQLGISSANARRYIARFFELYSGVKAWRDLAIANGYANGYVTTLLGRRRYVDELATKNHTQRSYGERICANTPIQGSGADICKLAMLNIGREIDERGLDANMLMQIHDELVFEAPEDEVDAVVELVRRHMETVVRLKVPLVVDVGIGDTWSQAH